MTICELWMNTFKDANTIWAAVEAISTAIAALVALVGVVVIYKQIKRLRQASIAHHIEGLKYAYEQINTPDFQQWEDVVKSAWKDQSEEYPKYAEGEIVSILARLDYLAHLIERDYIPKDLFLYVFGNQLSSIGAAFTNFRYRDKRAFEGARVSYPKGLQLLQDSTTYSQKHSAEAFDSWDRDL